MAQAELIQKINAVWVPLRKRLLELNGNKDGLLAVLGTNNLFEVLPEGFEYPKMMVALQASRGVKEFRGILKGLVEKGDWKHYTQAVTSIPEQNARK